MVEFQITNIQIPNNQFSIMLHSVLYKLSEARTYFLRGHSNWLAYPISMLNFISISFYLLIDSLTIIPDEFKRLRYYIVLFIFTYIPSAIIIGYYDMRKGAYRVEQKIARELSPIWVEVFDKFNRLEIQQKQLLQMIEKLRKVEE